MQMEYASKRQSGMKAKHKNLMKYFYLFLIFLSAGFETYAYRDTTVIVPLQRRYFHDKIINEQKLCDKADGKLDNFIRLGKNESINLHVSDAMFRKVKDLQDWIELNAVIKNNNEKIRYLAYVESMLRSFRVAWKKREISPVIFPSLMENFEVILKAQIDGKSMTPYIETATWEVAKLNTEIFSDNPGYKESKDIVYLKFCSLNPDKILQTIKPYADKPFADSLIVIASEHNPVQL